MHARGVGRDLTNPDTGQIVRLHVTFRLVYVSQEENEVEATSFTLACLGRA